MKVGNRLLIQMVTGAVLLYLVVWKELGSSKVGELHVVNSDVKMPFLVWMHF